MSHLALDLISSSRVHVISRPSTSGRYCSLISGLGVKLSAIILAGPIVLSAGRGMPSA